MKYNYKIIYDIKKDMWNWLGAVGDSFMGSANIDNIDNESDRNVANQILAEKAVGRDNFEAIFII